MKPVRIHPAAESEAARSAQFYERRVAGLGVDFLDEVDSAIVSIQLAPHVWPKRKYGTQRYLIHRFPFEVVYLDLPETIWIVAVAHLSRRPYYWRKRMRQIR